MITYRNKLSVTPGGRPTVVHLNQNDADFTLIFDLYSVYGDLTIQSGSSVLMDGRHENGTPFSINGSISGTVVTIPGSTSLTSDLGKAVGEVTITKSGKRLSTSNILFIIEPRA
jgi:hypothetical protein